MLKLWFAATLFAIAVVSGAQSQAVLRWEKFRFDKEFAYVDDLKKLTELELKHIRGIVFGRHGRVFAEPAIQAYLEKRPWYKPDPKYKVEVLNGVERVNMDLIKAAEFSKHTKLEPGDLKFFQGKPIPKEKLGQYTDAEWRIMIAEIEAIRGKTFPDEPWVQSFFDARYWYKRSTTYNRKQLSKNEIANLDFLTNEWKRAIGILVSPCEMDKFRLRQLTSEMLKGLSLYDLRIIRNELYARRGHEFRTPWLDMHFSSLDWYEGNENPEPLSTTENRNVAAILKRENELHEDLSKKPISKEFLEGLFLEDARKLRYEIYARHGKAFQQKWLQSYFESLPWYKRNPAYSDALLSSLEKRNINTLTHYEKRILPSMNSMAA